MGKSVVQSASALELFKVEYRVWFRWHGLGHGGHSMKFKNNNGVYRFFCRTPWLFAACAALWCATPDNAGAEVRVTAGLERFSWSEYNGGGKLLDESGLRNSVGLSWLMNGTSGLLFGYNGRFYTGDVTYAGQTNTGGSFSSTSGYQGMLNEAVLHYRLDSGIQPDETGRHYLDLVTGLGLDYWVREIKGKGNVSGYKETYSIGFLRAGLAMLPVKNGMEVAAGLKYPLYLNEKVAFPGADGDVAVSPNSDVSYYGSIGWRFSNPLSVTLDFDSYRFRASDYVPYTAGGVAAGSIHQPESRMEVYTLKVGYSF